MKPQNHSERQNAIFQFWAIYIVALLFPMVAFYFLFKNTTGGGPDYDKLQRQIAEFNALAKATTELDSIAQKIYSIDIELASARPIDEKNRLRREAQVTVRNINERAFGTLDKASKVTQSDAVKQFIKNIKEILNHYLGYHDAFMARVDFATSEQTKEAELTQLKLNNSNLTQEVGGLRAEIEGLKGQLASCNTKLARQ